MMKMLSKAITLVYLFYFVHSVAAAPLFNGVVVSDNQVADQTYDYIIVGGGTC